MLVELLALLSYPLTQLFTVLRKMYPVFREFYETLYKSEGDAPATMHEFLNKLNLQTLMMRIESTWRKRLGNPFSTLLGENHQG